MFLSETGDILAINSTAKEFLGLGSRDVIGMAFRSCCAEKAAFKDFQASPVITSAANNGAPQRVSFLRGKAVVHGFIRAFKVDGGGYSCTIEDFSGRQSQRETLQILISLSARMDIPLPDMLDTSFKSMCENFDLKSVALIATTTSEPSLFSAFPKKAGEKVVAGWEADEKRRMKGAQGSVLSDIPLKKYQNGKRLYFPLHVSDCRWGYLIIEGNGLISIENLIEQRTFLRSLLMWMTGRLSEYVARQHLIDLNETIREAEERFRTLYRGTPVMMHSIDEESCLLEVSDTWLQKLGYTREEVIGRRSVEFMNPASQQFALAKAYPDFFRTGIAHNVPYTYLRKDGTPVEVETSAVLYTSRNGGKQSLAVIVDVTERNRALKEIEEKRASLKKANNSLRKFTYIASHDFQEPLRKMQQFSYLLRNECEAELSDEGKEYLNIIANAAQRMSTLIGDLLLYSRITNSLPDLTEVDLNDMVESAVESEQRQMETEIEIDVSQDVLPVIYADRLQVQRLIRVFVSNAIKFRHHERKLHFSVSFTHAPGGQGYVLRFSDNGIGFENRYEDKIFEPLQKLHTGQLYGGTGMGLAIARSICENHYWQISAEGTLNEGAHFTITLPATTLVPTEFYPSA